ncbi:MAG: adenylate/guanylate cyclase domain-containing protein [Acidobacteria bacterium]|nr:adenylate/guanylate cyclase domain-containing protein [Acidobacteriota bacterium]
MNWLRTRRAYLKAHKSPVFLSLTLTLTGLLLYAAIYLAEWRLAPLDFLDSIELRSYDTRFKLRGPAPPSGEVVIVAIDSRTVDELGSFPFSRRHFARMLDQVTHDGVKVVGFDINFPKPDEKSGREAVRRARAAYLARVPPARRDTGYLARLDALEREADADRQLAAAIRGADNVVLGQFFYFNPDEIEHIDLQTQAEYDSILAFGAYNTFPLRRQRGEPLPPLTEIFLGPEAALARPNLALLTDAANYNFGYFNFFPGADPVMRRAPLVIRYQKDFHPSLDIQVVKRFLDVPEQEFGIYYNVAGVEYIGLGRLRVPTDAQGRMYVNYRGTAQTFPHYSLADVVAGRFAPGTFTNKIVLIGPTALGIPDHHPTPFQETGFPGVEIHANVLDTILNQRFIARGSREQLIDLALIAILGLVLGAALVEVRLRWTLPIAALVLGAHLASTYMALVRFNVWLSAVIPALVVFANWGGITAYRALFEEREKRKVRSAFEQYVAPGVIRELLKDPTRLRLGGEERELTVLFADIRGFTDLFEQLSALELTRFLNAYTDEMTEIIFRHWGTLDKFEGDAIMAFWGAPYQQDDHARRACAAALEMVRRVDELHARWRAEGKPAINIGLGLSTGRVVVGNMGSRKRFNYTVLGDAVNLAARLEGVNKEYATRILVSETTYRAAQDALFVFRELDWIRVKGRREPVVIYELLDDHADGQRWADLVDLFRRGLTAYRTRHWDAAQEFFQQVLEKYAEDGPAQLFLRRCQQFIQQEPNPDWDGVYVMKTK